jgi:HEAT repeat protein
MLKVGVHIVDVQGAAYISSLMELFETSLATPSSTDSEDRIKEAVIVLFGRLARHLEQGDDRLPTIVDRLVQALKIPSEPVQLAVSECLGPLVTGISEPVRLVDKLLAQSTTASRYAERRGAAYGLAGVVQGLGISAMKTYNIIERLRQSLEKKQFESRQGAMFTIETLSLTLGRLLEPFITQVLPLLLIAFGDATADVREATVDASKALMSSVSGYGVKLILPSLLSGLEEKQWRTKKGAIELLGSMAYCSPKQLSLSLPTIIPRLTGVLTDSHAQVRTSANKSLKQFGEVISNPEIQRMVPVLLKGLVDPDKIPQGLSSLLKTSFMHYIDSPSLALVWNFDCGAKA